MNFPISSEIADEQMNVFLNGYEIDLTDIQSDTARDSIESTIKKVKKAIRLGRCEITEADGTITIKQFVGGSQDEDSMLKWSDKLGPAKIAIGKKGENDAYGKMFAMAGSLTGVGESAISKLRPVDQSLCECIVALFLAV